MAHPGKVGRNYSQVYVAPFIRPSARMGTKKNCLIYSDLLQEVLYRPPYYFVWVSCFLSLRHKASVCFS